MGRRTAWSPAIAQDAATGRVLMVAWMNREALEHTVQTGEAVYWSRSRQQLWRKGEESGHVQKVQRAAPRLRRRRDPARGGAGGRHRLPHRARELFLPALEDGKWVVTDPVLKDPARSTREAIASRDVEMIDTSILDRLAETIEARKGADPASSYVAQLLRQGRRRDPEEDRARRRPRRCWRRRTVINCTSCGKPPTCGFTAWCCWLHGLGPDDVLAELRRREGISGIDEKASRRG